MFNSRKLKIYLLISLFFPVLVLAGQVADKIEIVSPFSRVTLPGQKNSAIYFEIKNTDVLDHYLYSAKVDIAEHTHLHKTVEKNGIVSMVNVDKVLLPAKSSIEFAPGGLHVMLIGLNKNLVKDDEITLNLQFEDDSKLITTVPVRDYE